MRYPIRIFIRFSFSNFYCMRIFTYALCVTEHHIAFFSSFILCNKLQYTHINYQYHIKGMNLRILFNNFLNSGDYQILNFQFNNNIYPLIKNQLWPIEKYQKSAHKKYTTYILYLCENSSLVRLGCFQHVICYIKTAACGELDGSPLHCTYHCILKSDDMNERCTTNE